jgi:pyrroloquinoline quinone (PQQ) biosynthesis protein C
MIANALRLDIERYAVEVRTRNPLFTRAAAGTLTPAHVAAYLENVRYLITHTPRHLAIARDRARERGEDNLAAHYERRLREEDGHDAWAEDDLHMLQPVLVVPPSGRILDSMVELVRYVGRRADEQPLLHLAYMLLAEYLTVIIGPDWLRVLEERCGVERRAMTVVSKHVDLDRGHVEHALEEIDDLVTDPAMLAPMRETLRESIARFEAFCREVAFDDARGGAYNARSEASAA